MRGITTYMWPTCGLVLEAVGLLVAVGSGYQPLGPLQLERCCSRYTKSYPMTQLTNQRIIAECERIVSINDRHIRVASVAEFRVSIASGCSRSLSESLSLVQLLSMRLAYVVVPTIPECNVQNLLGKRESWPSPSQSSSAENKLTRKWARRDPDDNRAQKVTLGIAV